MLPANTTLTKIDNNLSPLENAAGVTLVEVEELEKKEKDDSIKIASTNSTAEAKPDSSAKIQTG